MCCNTVCKWVGVAVMLRLTSGADWADYKLIWTLDTHDLLLSLIAALMNYLLELSIKKSIIVTGRAWPANWVALDRMGTSPRRRPACPASSITYGIAVPLSRTKYRHYKYISSVGIIIHNSYYVNSQSHVDTYNIRMYLPRQQHFHYIQ